VAFLHKAPVALQREFVAVLAAQAAVEDEAHRRLCDGNIGRARGAVPGLERLASLLPSSANFVLGRFGAQAASVRGLGAQAILVRDRTTKRPGACASRWARAIRRAACWRP